VLVEPFTHGRSFIHRLDPRVRIAVSAVFSCLVAVANSFTVLAIACVIALGLVLLARLNLAAVGRRLSVVLGFLILLWLILPLTYDGDPVGQLGPLVWHRPGVALAARISLKSFAILTAFTALLATMSVSTLGHALDRMGLPAKLVHLLLMCYRYIFVIEQEYRRLNAAMRIRAFRPRTSLHTYRSYAYLVGMLFVRAAARAERVHQAMLCRGFQGRFHSMARFPRHAGNRLFLVATTSVMLGMVWLEWLR
jgi:cobalt/nickel transport system permease protein